jgi:hypothetical protein
MTRGLGLRAIGCCAVAVAAGGLAGCSVHPLPQDISNASTVDIVRRVRCEAQEGLKEALQKAASRGAKEKKHVQKIVEGTTIGFEFKFVMSEANTAGVDEIKFKGEDFELILNAALNDGHKTDPVDNATRSNTRVFRVLDDLRDLAETRCGRRVRAAQPNLPYPVTGSTGMAEVVRTYIELEILTDLAATGSNKETVTFSDNLQFTTTLDTGAFLDLSLKTAVGSLRLTKASATAARKDTHSVRVVLARDGEHVDVDLPEDARKTVAGRMAQARGKIDRATIKAVRGKGLQEHLAQRREQSRNRVLIELNRQRRVADDKAVAERVLGTLLP